MGYAADARHPSFRHPRREPEEFRRRLFIVGPAAPHAAFERCTGSGVDWNPGLLTGRGQRRAPCLRDPVSPATRLLAGTARKAAAKTAGIVRQKMGGRRLSASPPASTFAA